MEVGAEYEGRRLHGKRYFGELLKKESGDQPGVAAATRVNRSQIESLATMDQQLMRLLQSDGRLSERVKALQKIDGVGPVTALDVGAGSVRPEAVQLDQARGELLLA